MLLDWKQGLGDRWRQMGRKENDLGPNGSPGIHVFILSSEEEICIVLTDGSEIGPSDMSRTFLEFDKNNTENRTE